jgi:ribose transport system permease protein
MEIQFDDNIKRARYPLLTWLTSRQAFWVSVAVILACIFLSFATNSFATSNNIFNVARNFTFVAIIALGMTIVIITGGIDLSVGSVLCLCSMILAVVMHAGYGIEVGIAASLGTALLIGAINGVLIAYLGIPPFVVTLGMLSIARSLAMVASNNTVVFQFGPDHDKLLFLGGGALLFGIANPVIYMLALTLLTGFLLHYTRFGRYVFAIGGNEHAAIVTGVPVRRTKVAVYMISALSAGIAGVIETGWLGAVTTNLGSGMELQVIAAAVIGGANLAGGIGGPLGAIVGCVLLEVIRNGLVLAQVNSYWQQALVGVIIILAVLVDRIRSRMT